MILVRSWLGRHPHPAKQAMRRCTSRLTAACVVLATALAQLAPARAEPRGDESKVRTESGGNRCRLARQRQL